MSVVTGMETYAARLESFETARSTTKGGSKSSKALKWPHKTPSPAQLARAGFYYAPSASSPDNVICVSCQKSLDGWESEDDPIKEHVEYSSTCCLAIHANIEQQLEAGDREIDNPLSENMIEARKATFGDMWPHEKKRGWTCKVQKMVDAGWYYCPTPDSDDFVKCAYCSLSLDGWEPKDKPFEEHQRRSVDCIFFEFQAPAKPKGAKGRKGRASKTSRMSTQSTATVATEDAAMQDSAVDEDISMMSSNTDVSMLSTATGKGKNTAKGKKGKGRGKAAKAQEAVSPEPEDEDFEVKIVEEPTKSTRGKKRNSDEMQVEGDMAPPPAKRRGTRARSSTVKPEPVLVTETTEDVNMTDAEELPPPASKKGAKGRKRASSTTRKASTMSTASKASLRAAVPADEEIEAALEADLEKPLSDEDKDTADPAPIRKASRAKQSSKKAPASTASVRKAKSSILSEIELPNQDNMESMDIDDTMHTTDEPIVPIKHPKGRQGKKTKKPATQDLDTQFLDTQQSFVESQLETQPEESTKPTGGKGRQASRQTSRQKATAKAAQEAELAGPSTDDSLLSTSTAVDDSGHDTDASHATVKRGAKAKAPAKRGRKPKNSITAQKNVEEIIQPVSEPAESGTDDAPTVTPVEEVPAPATVVKTTKAKGARGRPKGKKASTASAAPAEPVQVEESDKGTELLEAVEAELEQPVEQLISETLTASEPEAEHPQSEDPVLEPEVEQHQTKKPSLEPKVEYPQIDEPASEPAAPEAESPAPEAPQTSPPKSATPKKSSPAQQIPSPTPSPQSSDAENHPPSSRPSQARPLAPISPSKHNTTTTRVQIAASTPTSRPKRSGQLESEYPWTSVDLEEVLLGIEGAMDKENGLQGLRGNLTSPEKRMSVEEWIMSNAKNGEEQLRNECERVVARFESEGVRAMKALEGIVSE